MLDTIINSLQVYGIAIVVSMLVAAVIKLLVFLTGNISSPKKAEEPVKAEEVQMPSVQPSAEIPGEVIAAIAAAISASMGRHRILHIAQGSRAWSHQGRSAQHAHQPRQ